VTRHMLLFGACLLTVGWSPASAELTKDVTVSADVVSGCRIATTASNSFGDADLGSYPGTSTATAEAVVVGAVGNGLKVQCTPGVQLNLSADGGDHAAGGQRYLAGPASSTPIAYSLYANGSGTPWTNNSIPLAFTSISPVQTVPIVVRSTLPGNARAGTYTDAVRVTLSW
jgi:spore coat protein U-like protein